jgi:sec-independent protein translocase protein TatA
LACACYHQESISDIDKRVIDLPRIGLPELLIILIAILLIFGPKNLPKLGAALGKTVKNLRDGVNGKGGSSDEADEADDEAGKSED